MRLAVVILLPLLFALSNADLLDSQDVPFESLTNDDVFAEPFSISSSIERFDRRFLYAGCGYGDYATGGQSLSEYYAVHGTYGSYLGTNCDSTTGTSSLTDLGQMTAQQRAVSFDFSISDISIFNDASKKQQFISAALDAIYNYYINAGVKIKKVEIFGDLKVEQARRRLLAAGKVTMETILTFQDGVSSDDINNAVKSLVAAVGSNWRTVFGSSLDAYGVTGVEAKENSGDDDNAVALGVGIGIGVGVPVLILVIVLVVIMVRRKKQAVAAS